MADGPRELGDRRDTRYSILETQATTLWRRSVEARGRASGACIDGSVFQPLLRPPRRIDSRCVHFSAGPGPSIENPFICITFVFANNNEIDRCAQARDILPVPASSWMSQYRHRIFLTTRARAYFFFSPEQLQPEPLLARAIDSFL